VHHVPPPNEHNGGRPQYHTEDVSRPARRVVTPLDGAMLGQATASPRWSKLDTTWEGVSVDTLLAEVDHDAAYVLAFCDGGCTTNLPLEDVTGGKAWASSSVGRIIK
jgi:hypothetical protein